jgi:hypothetical protein
MHTKFLLGNIKVRDHLELQYENGSKRQGVMVRPRSNTYPMTCVCKHDMGNFLSSFQERSSTMQLIGWLVSWLVSYRDTGKEPPHGQNLIFFYFTLFLWGGIPTGNKGGHVQAPDITRGLEPIHTTLLASSDLGTDWLGGTTQMKVELETLHELALDVHDRVQVFAIYRGSVHSSNLTSMSCFLRPSPGVKRPGRKPYHSPPSSAQVKNAWG